MNEKFEVMMKMSAGIPTVLLAEDDVDAGMLCKLTGDCSITCNGGTCTGTCPATS